MNRLILIALSLLIAATNLAHGADEEGGLWTTFAISKGVTEKVAADLVLQLRYDDDISQLERTLVRPSVAYRIDQRQAVTLGYDAHFIETPKIKVEQRLWQQYTIKQDYARVTGLLRLRLEERFVDHIDRIPVRVRIKPAVKLPIVSSQWFLSVANEVFLGFNEVSGAQRGGFHENRVLVGFGRPLGNGLSGQVGYQNQFFDGVARDRMIHQVFVSIAVKLP